MNRARLRRLRSQIEQVLASPRGHKSRDFIRLALKLGRRRVNRGKEPTYVRVKEPQLMPPLSIPYHGSDIKVGVACTILDRLMDDADTWEQWLDQHPEADDREG